MIIETIPVVSQENLSRRSRVETVNERMPRIGIIRIPDLSLVDKDGFSWTTDTRFTPSGPLPIIGGTLQDAGCDVEIFNMASGDEQISYGQLDWEGKKLTTVMRGNISEPLSELIKEAKEGRLDSVAIPVNFRSVQNIALQVISELRSQVPDLKITVGGSDVFADPATYLQAGVDAVILNKRGAANKAVLEAVLNRKLPEGNLRGLEEAVKLDPKFAMIRPDFIITQGGERVGYSMRESLVFHSPTQPYLDRYQPIPSRDILEQTFGTVYWEASDEVVREIVGEEDPNETVKLATLRLDDGCDHACNFCQTPTYGGAYLEMSVEHALTWGRAVKEAGADAVVIISDQFLGRRLRLGGRQRIIDIANGMKKLGLAIFWGNGLEINKMTEGGGVHAEDVGTDFIRKLLDPKHAEELAKMLTPQDLQLIGEYREEPMDYERIAEILAQFKESVGYEEVTRLEKLIGETEEQAVAEARHEAQRAAQKVDPGKQAQVEEETFNRVIKRHKHGGQGTTLYKKAALALIAGGDSLKIGSNKIDEELVNALFGTRTQLYVPGERPVLGGTMESGLPKLLPPEDHVQALEAIVRTGIPMLTYGVILGFEDDSPEYVDATIAYLKELKTRLKRINLNLRFVATPFTNKPIPSTENAKNLDAKGFVVYNQPEIQGGFYTAAIKTNKMSVLDISESMQKIIQEVNGEEFLLLGNYASTALTHIVERERERFREN